MQTKSHELKTIREVNVKQIQVFRQTGLIPGGRVSCYDLEVTVSAPLSNECPTGFSGPDNFTQPDTETQTNWQKIITSSQNSAFVLLEASCNLLHHATAQKKHTVELSVANQAIC